MYLRLGQAELIESLIAHLRKGGFLVVRHDRHELEVHPLNPVSERYDLAKIEEALTQWREFHPEAEVETVS